jgi:L-rhamnose mutarotase
MMKRVAFKMQLHQGQVAEYKKRHDEIWADLVLLLKSIGIEDYSIFLDEETHILFAILKIENPALLDTLPAHDVMQKWWQYMGDIMDSNADNSPVVKPLIDVFYLK